MSDEPHKPVLDGFVESSLFKLAFPVLGNVCGALLLIQLQQVTSSLEAQSKRIADLKTIVTDLRVEVAGKDGVYDQKFANLEVRTARLEDRFDNQGGHRKLEVAPEELQRLPITFHW